MYKYHKYVAEIEASAPASVRVINIAMYVAGGVSALLLLVLLLFVISIRLEYRGIQPSSTISVSENTARYESSIWQ